MKLARKHRHSAFSVFHYTFSIDPNKSLFTGRGTEQLLCHNAAPGTGAAACGFCSVIGHYMPARFFFFSMLLSTTTAMRAQRPTLPKMMG